MSEQRLGLRLPLRVLPAYRLLVMLWGGLAVIDVSTSLRAPEGVSVAAVALVVAGCSVGLDLVTALLVAGVGWLLVNGFVVNGLGQLRWDGAGDLFRAAVLVLVAVAAAEVHR